jgi:altronate dehydratase
MADNIDVDVSGVMSEEETLDAAADRLFDEVLDVASGRPTAAERLGPSRVRDSPAESDDLRSVGAGG